MNYEERLDNQAAAIKALQAKVKLLEELVTKLVYKPVINGDDKLDEWLKTNAQTITLTKDGKRMLDINGIVQALEGKFSSQKIRARCKKLDLYL